MDVFTDGAVPSEWDDAAGSTLHAGSTTDTADVTTTTNGGTLVPFVRTAAILSTSTAASHAQCTRVEFRTPHAAK